MKTKLDVPRTHDAYRTLIEAIRGEIAGIKYGQGVSIWLDDGRKVDLVPEDGRLAIAMTDKAGTRRILPEVIDTEDINSFWALVHGNDA